MPDAYIMGKYPPNTLADVYDLATDLGSLLRATNQVDTVQVQDNAVGPIQLGSGSVGQTQLANGAFSADVAGEAKMADGYTQPSHFFPQAVLTGNIAALAVAFSKFASGISVVGQTSGSYSGNGTGGDADPASNKIVLNYTPDLLWVVRSQFPQQVALGIRPIGSTAPVVGDFGEIGFIGGINLSIFNAVRYETDGFTILLSNQFLNRATETYNYVAWRFV